MSEARVHPFSLVFGGLVDEYFPRIRNAAPDAPDLDTFLMAEPAISLLQALRPDEGLGEGRDDFVMFVHAAYRFWADGSETQGLDLAQTRQLLATHPARRADPVSARYIQLAPRILWGALEDEDHHEPLDGWFTVPIAEGLRVVGIFGVHSGRPGLSVAVVEGRIERVSGARADGSALFAPTMTGGDVAGLHSIASLEELLLMAWRAEESGADR